MRAGVDIARYVANGLEGLVVPTVINMVADDLADAVAKYIPACQMCGSMLAQLGGDVPNPFHHGRRPLRGRFAGTVGFGSKRRAFPSRPGLRFHRERRRLGAP